MPRTTLLSALLLLLLPAMALGQKEALNDSITNREADSWDMALKIWKWAEVGYKEAKSSALLADRLEKAGFTVKRGVAKIPTAFTATAGEGKPVLGVLGEFDALPGLSQEAVPVKERAKDRSAGHACGHHVFGVASASACIALAEQIKAGKVKGTLRYYGCPAEEGGSAKVFMTRDGLFDDCDVVLHWHPGSRNSAGDSSCLSRIAVKFRFHGSAAHASGSPEKGRSALDAVELTNHAAQLLREHVPDSTRIHHIITAGGDAPNVVPDFAEAFYYIRHPSSETVAKLYPRLLRCARAGEIATETKLEVIHLGGTMELLPNEALSRVIKANLVKLNDLSYTPEEKTFALRLQESFLEKAPLENVGRVFDSSGKVGGGSTDVGDVSWVVPTAGFSTACWVPGTPGHSWQAVACGGTSIARKGMQLAAKVMAASAWDLYHDARRIEAAKAEHRRRLDGRKYKPLLEPGQEPPLTYRDPPRR
jgi:aminobenzoyl-glutamate utilization protein B